MQLGIVSDILNQTKTGVGHYVYFLIQGLISHPKVKKLMCYHGASSSHPHFENVKEHLFHPWKIPFGPSLAALFHYRCFHQVQCLHFPVPSILFGKKPKAPYVITIHDLIPLIYPQWFPKTHVAQMRYFLPYYLKHARKVIAVSKHTKRDLLRFFHIQEEKIEVIYPGIPEISQKISENPLQDPYILYIGSFDPRKNIKGILQGFAYLRSLGFPHKLVLVGKENPKTLSSIPRDVIQKLQLEKEVHLTGYVSEEKKQALLQHASILVFPSFYEGFGFPLLEAMQYGVPVVTSFGSCLEEVGGNAALFVNPHDPVDIGKKMETVLVSKEEQVKLAEEGKKRIQQFSLKTMSEKHVQVYQKILTS